MGAWKPSSKPQITREECVEIIEANGLLLEKNPVILLGIRGYYLDSYGEKGKNDRGGYDDSFQILTKNGFVTYNGNTDPSTFRKGKGSGKDKGMAMLNPGIYDYKPGMHNGSVPHPAFRQAGPVRITRDGVNGSYQDTLASSINIHRGGKNGTSSLACQTVPPDQWLSFKAYLDGELKRYGVKTFKYVLIEETLRRRGNLLAA
jgi:lysozyme